MRVHDVHIKPPLGQALSFLAALDGRLARLSATISAQQDMYVEYDPFSSGFFDISYSSDANYVHTVTLTSHAATQNRGWGTKNSDRARYASAYLLNIAVNHLECDVAVAAPLDACISRHATTPGAPYSNAELQAKKANFYGVLATPCGDADGDGVSDQDDLCGHTLDGTEVDANGCSVSSSLTCNDQTYSQSCTCQESWQGCCSYHGGVAGCG